MVDDEPVDDTLSRIFGEVAPSVADEDRALGVVVGRARTRVRRRRLGLLTGALAVVVALAGASAVLRGGGHSAVHVEASRELSAADVTFRIFRRPATAADAIPPEFAPSLTIDPKIGSRLAIRTATVRVYAVASPPNCRGLLAVQSTGRPCPPGHPAGGENYCVAVVRAASAGAGCTTAAAIAQVGVEIGADSSGKHDTVTYGIVPDFVSSIRYLGHAVPIVNNAFLIEGPANWGSLVFATPDGDKSLRSHVSPSTLRGLGAARPG